ncbi:hypothetical protein [Algoriphagus sp. CAU 1675]|uniref:hypothetical protein n=1 Tax=Algoriphagus sp. CAU 1675 TaxID=3032597 RepID=UPI0023DB5A9E|nr:hypothetical protein [Algoriphagus sp. CAU 1675]MDF2157054.1 hypothetical protein [Algoriphagus sp. CAU 1675]
MFRTSILTGLICLIGFSSCGEDQDPLPNSNELPEILLGTWLDEWSFTSGYAYKDKLYNPATGQWFDGAYDPWSMNPRPGFGIEIFEDGTFSWSTVVSTGVGGCQAYIAEYLEGKVEFVDDQLVFSPDIRRKKYHSSCNPSMNFDRNEPTSAFQMGYRLQVQDWGLGRSHVTLKLLEGSSERAFQTIKQN